MSRIAPVEPKGRHKGRLTLSPNELAHLGVAPGDRLIAVMLPEGTIGLRVERRSPP
jgi:hypothetical protein